MWISLYIWCESLKCGVHLNLADLSLPAQELIMLTTLAAANNNTSTGCRIHIGDMADARAARSLRSTIKKNAAVKFYSHDIEENGTIDAVAMAKSPNNFRRNSEASILILIMFPEGGKHYVWNVFCRWPISNWNLLDPCNILMPESTKPLLEASFACN